MHKIEMVAPNKLKPRPDNRNKHPDDQIDRLVKVIEYQGFRRPVIVSNQSGQIVCGHGRLLAAKRLKLKQVPVIYQDYADPAQEYADHVADNAIAEWADLDLSAINTDLANLGEDFDVELLGIKDFVLEPAELIPQADEDEVPDHVEPRTKLGDVYTLGRHRLMCGDSTSIDAVEKLLGGNVADFGFCDPPYNLGFEYNDYEDNKSESEYADFSHSWFNNLSMVTARQAVTLGTKNIPLMSTLGKVAGVACWVKKNWITPCHIAKLQQWEPIFFYGDFTKHKRTSDLFEINRKYQADVGTNHTCPKQVELIDAILINYCDKSVVDLFGGSGTTMISAEKNGKTSFLCELDPHYCDVIVARWEKYTGKTAELTNGELPLKLKKDKHG